MKRHRVLRLSAIASRIDDDGVLRASRRARLPSFLR